MNRKRAVFVFGLFVITSVVFLTALAWRFGSVPKLLKSEKSYTVRFHDATGVGPGTPVRRSGVRIGQVEKLVLDDETGQVSVELAVGEQYTLRRSDQPTIVQGLLGGDTTIDFKPLPADHVPPPDPTPVEPGEWPEMGARQAGVSSLVSQAADVVPTTQETLSDIRKSLKKFENLTPQMEESMREFRDFSKAARESIPDLRKTNQEVQDLAKTTREAVPDFRKAAQEVEVTARTWNKLGERVDVFVQTNQDKAAKAIDNANDVLTRVGNVLSDENQRNLSVTLKNVRDGTNNLESLARNTEELVKESRQTVKRANESMTRADEVIGNLQKATKPVADRSETILRNLDEATQRFNGIMTDVQDLMRGVSKSDGAVRRFLSDPTLYNNLNDAACMLVRIMPRLDRMLKDVEVFADKIARHPELLGIGGAVSPSGGLKEGPSRWSSSPSRPGGH